MRIPDHRGVWLVASLLASVSFAQDETPSVDDFLRRGNSRASVLGHYIYFEAGEIAQEGEKWRWSNPVNSTLSIDLSKNWTPSDVRFVDTPKPRGTIPMSKQSIFTDERAGIFYVWGGHTSWFAKIGEPILRSFKPDNKGGGVWTEEVSSDTLRSAERVESGAYVSTPEAGYVFGGLSLENTSKEPKGYVTGYLTFNFSTKEWKSESSGPYSSDGTIYGATAVFVPLFGQNGFIFVLGGMSDPEGDSAEYITFRTLHLLDPVKKEWHTQVTTGEAPSGRHYHCSAGVASKNGTYEIFLFGGYNSKIVTDYSDMYVLSLPGFHWIKISGVNTEARAEHVCSVVGGRQLLSWGGNNGNRKEGRWEAKDSFPQGIGIFDMAAMEWKSSYDAAAKPYDSHSDIKEWYDKGGLDSVAWASPALRQAFVLEKAPKTDTGSRNNSGSQEGTNEGEKPVDEAEEEKPRSSKTPIGAIVGGVVGGVALLLCIGLAVWLIRRKNRRVHIPATEKPHPQLSQPMYYVPELHGESQPAELGAHGRPAELTGDSSVYK